MFHVDDASTLVTTWKKSSYSTHGACVEVASLEDGHKAVRHSKDPNGPALIFTEAEFSAFVDGAAALEFSD